MWKNKATLEEDLAVALDKAVRNSKQADFRHNEFKERRIKQALFEVLKNKDEVERGYNIVVEQEKYWRCWWFRVY